MIYDDTTIELDNVTLEECKDLYFMKNIYTEINDGRIVRLIKERGDKYSCLNGENSIR